MRIGFTGTQNGMTLSQLKMLQPILIKLKTHLNTFNSEDEFHHGDCIGSDAQAHDIAEIQQYKIVIHAPNNPTKRAWKYSEHNRRPYPYLVRNHHIVLETEYMIAAPAQLEEQVRSGTWATIRYARKLLKPIWILFPDGSGQQINHKETLWR